MAVRAAVVAVVAFVTVRAAVVAVGGVVAVPVVVVQRPDGGNGRKDGVVIGGVRARQHAGDGQRVFRVGRAVRAEPVGGDELVPGGQAVLSGHLPAHHGVHGL